MKNDTEKVDTESQSGNPAGEGKLVRQLKNRHIAMIRYGYLPFNTRKLLTPFISIGGVIGTGEY